MTDHYAAIEENNAIILAVSADDLNGAETAAHKWGAPFPILYNSDKSVITEYGLLAGNVANPSTFIIDKDGVIRWKYIGRGKDDRPSPETVLQQLRALEG
ncbi:MAG: peroxiredoxin family protein [Chloroflexi bacterium]|nr:peroxiredoxin family protein [Chloroflexota bacterium]